MDKRENHITLIFIITQCNYSNNTNNVILCESDDIAMVTAVI